MELEDTFGATVRRRREALRLTRGALAARVFCSEATIKKIERDERRPSPEIAALLLEHLLVPTAEHDEFLQRARGFRVEGNSQATHVQPPFLQRLVPVQEEVFVARERELEYLNIQLKLAVGHKGRTVFVTGSAGAGKSSLVRAFARQSLEQHSDLVVAMGTCTAYVGIGDPYQPFREQLDLLTGESALSYETDGLGSEAFGRLWTLMPLATDAILDQGTDLVGTFRSGTALAACLEQARAIGAPVASQAARLKALLATRETPALLHQRDLFNQFTRVLQKIAEQHPLLLVLDDLQWADEGSLSLLFHLGRRIAGHRILLVGIYRPLERNGDVDASPHPLQPVLNELHRLHGTRAIDLGQIERQEFIDELLDVEPNQLGPAFRAALYRQTGGHALFTVETLRDLQDRGVLVRDSAGVWIEAAPPIWDVLPARAEGVIRERLDRLPANLRVLLTAASVEGESFTAEVVAEVLQIDTDNVNLSLDAVLSGQQHLVDSEAGLGANGHRLHRYRFRHNLFQTYLYAAIGSAERARLHAAIGTALERLHANNLEIVAPQLAHHYVAAGLAQDAIRTLQIAAQAACRLFALGEALRSYDQAVVLAETHSDPSDQTELSDLREERGHVRAEAGAFAGAVEDFEAVLATNSVAGPPRYRALTALGMTHRRQDDYDAARARLAEALDLARAAVDMPAVANILYHLGTVEWSDGDNAEAATLHEEAVAICKRENLGGLVAIQALHGWGEALFAQARPNRARESFAESLALARAAGDRSYEAENLMMIGYSTGSFAGLGHYAEAADYFDQALAISQAAQLDWHSGYILAGRGQARGFAGDYANGIADLTAALQIRLSAGTARYQIMALDMLGDLIAELEEHERVLEIRKLTLRRAEEEHTSFLLPRQQANLALAQLALGDTSVGPQLRAALERARLRAQRFHATRCLEGLAAVALARGSSTEALSYANQLLDLARIGEMHENEAIARLWRGKALAAAQRAAEAEGELLGAASIFNTLGRPYLQIKAHDALADLFDLADRTTDANEQRSTSDAIAAQIRRPSAEALAITDHL